MSSNYIIEVNGLGKCYQIYDKPSDRLKQMLSRGRKQFYKEFWALKNVSFKIKKGETVGIIGRNGSGKSTLLQLICGTLNPTAGEVKVKGRVAALLELGSGFNPEFTGQENVYMNASILGLTQKEIDNRYANIVEFADIGDFVDQPVKTYSSGMMVRLAFAVIAHVDADVLVIDEALAVGDAFFTQKCMRFLREFMKKGTVLFVSHDTGSIKNLCSKAIWLDKGQIIHSGSPKDVCERYLEVFCEAQQGKTNAMALRMLNKIDDQDSLVDQRMKFINSSQLRNDLRIFKFDPSAASFGKGGAQILAVKLLGEDERVLSWIVGGEVVKLRVVVHAHQYLDSPIIGFFVKDRLGQTLFGDNTFLFYEKRAVDCQQGKELQADFTFRMPVLPIGEYSITVAIANGNQQVHEQHHWIHDALIFKSESSSVTSGLIGIPMLNVVLLNL